MLRREMLLGSLGSLALTMGHSLGLAEFVKAARGTAYAGPVVRTQQGEVRGSTVDGVTVFKGIPFAASPFAANHLRPPQPSEPWEGVRDALAYGPKPPQAPYPPGIAQFLSELVGPGEDCLTLNIWTPEVGAARRPVMVRK